MPAVGAAISAVAVKFAATKVGTFLLTKTLGRLLTSVAFSALQGAIARRRQKSPGAQATGIRTTTTQTGGANPASFIFGTYATEGVFVSPPRSHRAAGGSPGEYLTYVIEVSDVPVFGLTNRIFIDGVDTPIGPGVHPEYGLALGGIWTGHAWVRFYNGTQTAADPTLLQKYGGDALRPWTADMVGRGIAYAIVTFLANPQITNAFPKVRFEVHGISLYDPRQDSSVGGLGPQRYNNRATWQWSVNPAVQAYNILRGIDIGGGYVWGGGADAEDLPLETWWAAMNKADAAVALAAGGVEPQYRTSLEVYVEDEPADVIEEILSAVGGDVTENGGVWKIRLGGPSLPVYFFSDSDIVASEPEEFSPFSVEREPYNGVRVVYPDPANIWEPRDAPARYDAEFALADPAQRRVADLTLPACPYPGQVQRVMRAYLEEEARAIRHTLTLPPDALVLEPLDVVSWSSQSQGYTAKAFEVDAMTDPLVTGQPRLVLKERDPEDAAWIPGYELPYIAPETGVQAIPPEAVGGFAVVAAAVQDENGVDARPAIRVSWTAPSADVRGLSFEVEAADGTSIVKITTLNVAAGDYVLTEGILPNKAYRVRARLIVDRPTVWTDYAFVTAPDLRTRPEDVDSVAFQVAGLSIFGGTLRSGNFQSGVAGWQITQAGDAEFNNLIARSSLRVGAVSDLVEQVTLPAAYLPQNTDYTYFTSGPASASEFVHAQYHFEYRASGVDEFTTRVGDETQQSSRTATTRLILDYRFIVAGGAATPWARLVDTGDYSGDWTARGDIIHLVGAYVFVQFRLFSAPYQFPADIIQTNVRNVFFRTQRVAR